MREFYANFIDPFGKQLFLYENWSVYHSIFHFYSTNMVYSSAQEFGHVLMKELFKKKNNINKKCRSC